MRALQRFFTTGLADADARVSHLLAPRSFRGTDHYLSTSAVVRAADTATRRMHEWWQASTTGRVLQTHLEDWRGQDWSPRYEAIAVVLLFAVAAHVLLTVVNGPRPGWFWLILPGLAATLAVVLLAGSRARRPH